MQKNSSLPASSAGGSDDPRFSSSRHSGSVSPRGSQEPNRLLFPAADGHHARSAGGARGASSPFIPTLDPQYATIPSTFSSSSPGSSFDSYGSSSDSSQPYNALPSFKATSSGAVSGPGHNSETVHTFVPNAAANYGLPMQHAPSPVVKSTSADYGALPALPGEIDALSIHPTRHSHHGSSSAQQGATGSDIPEAYGALPSYPTVSHSPTPQYGALPSFPEFGPVVAMEQRGVSPTIPSGMSALRESGKLKLQPDQQDLLNLLRDEKGMQQFSEFLRTEYAEENLNFWRQVEELHRVPDEDVPAKAQQIYRLFIESDTLNLAYQAKRRLREAFGGMGPLRVDRHIFDEDQANVLELMANDNYRRFAGLRQSLRREPSAASGNSPRAGGLQTSKSDKKETKQEKERRRELEKQREQAEKEAEKRKKEEEKRRKKDDKGKKSLRLEDQDWYKRNFSREQAEAILRLQTRNAFLVRDSSKPGCFACSLFNHAKRSIEHSLIVPVGAGFQFESEPGEFPDIVTLVNESPFLRNYFPVQTFPTTL